MSNKPKLRFKEFNDSIVECRIENVLKIKHGKDQKAIECKDGIYPILATSGEIGRTNTYLWNRPCVLIGRKGTINKPQYMDTPFWTVDTLFYSDVNSSNIAKYLYYLFNTINWKRYDESTGVPSLSAKTVERIKVIITNNKDEQKKIADFLSKVDEIIAEREEEVKDLEQQKKGLMQKIFSQQLRFTDSNNNPYPEWEEINIGNVGTVVTGNTPKTEDKDNYGTDFLWCSPADLGSTKYITKTQKMLSKKGFNYTRKLPANSVMVTCIGSTIGKIGISSCEMSTNQQINSIIPNNNNADFIYYALIYSFPRYISVIATQAVPIINKTEFEKLMLQVPCLEEQQKIANLLSKLDELIEEKKALLSDWQSFKKGLLQQMFV